MIERAWGGGEEVPCFFYQESIPYRMAVLLFSRKKAKDTRQKKVHKEKIRNSQTCHDLKWFSTLLLRPAIHCLRPSPSAGRFVLVMRPPADSRVEYHHGPDSLVEGVVVGH